MTDNPFLAGIERQGALRNSRESILEVLEEKFGNVPEEIRAGLNTITDLDRLKRALRKAARCESLQAFSEKND